MKNLKIPAKFLFTPKTLPTYMGFVKIIAYFWARPRNYQTKNHCLLTGMPKDLPLEESSAKRSCISEIQSKRVALTLLFHFVALWPSMRRAAESDGDCHTATSRAASTPKDQRRRPQLRKSLPCSGGHQ